MVNKTSPILSSTYCGSLAYAAPEVLNGEPYNPKKSDLWSLGVLIFVLLNRSLPFKQTTVREMYKRQINRAWEYKSNVKKIISNELKELLPQILEPDTEKRFTIEDVLISKWIRTDSKLAGKETYF